MSVILAKNDQKSVKNPVTDDGGEDISVILAPF